MSFLEELGEQVGAIFREGWSSREGQLIPLPENLKLGNDFRRA